MIHLDPLCEAIRRYTEYAEKLTYIAGKLTRESEDLPFNTEMKVKLQQTSDTLIENSDVIMKAAEELRQMQLEYYAAEKEIIAKAKEFI